MTNATCGTDVKAGAGLEQHEAHERWSAAHSGRENDWVDEFPGRCPGLTNRCAFGAKVRTPVQVYSLLYILSEDSE